MSQTDLGRPTILFWLNHIRLTDYERKFSEPRFRPGLTHVLSLLPQFNVGILAKAYPESTQKKAEELTRVVTFNRAVKVHP